MNTDDNGDDETTVGSEALRVDVDNDNNKGHGEVGNSDAVRANDEGKAAGSRQ